MSQTMFSAFCYRHFLTSIFIVIFSPIFTQSGVYSLNPSKESILLGAGAGLNILGYFENKKVTILTIAEIEKLRRSDLDGLDRSATYNYSISAKKVSDIYLMSSLGLPLMSLANENGRTQLGHRGLIALEAYLLNAGATLLIKSSIKRTRPFVYNESAPLSEKLKPDARMSFFSGHTSFTATSCFLTASLMTANNSNRDCHPYIWSAAAVTPLVQGYLRWKAGKHFPTDIFIGYVVGASIGYLVPKIHEAF